MSSKPSNFANVKALFKTASAFDQPEIPDMPKPQPLPTPTRVDKVRHIAALLDDAIADLGDGYPEDAVISIEAAISQLSEVEN